MKVETGANRMDFVQLFSVGSLGGLAFYFLSFIAALLIIIFIHEMGHFAVARWCGVKVEAFAIGFGKELWGFNDRHGTRWKICLWPIGGYVKFQGDANAASMPSDGEIVPDSLQAQPVPQRMAIVAAGPIANFILAIAIFTTIFTVVGKPYLRPIISEVVQGSAAEAAGLKAGDVVKSVAGDPVAAFTEIQEKVFLRPGEDLTVVVERNGQTINLQITPKAVEVKDNFGGSMKVGQLGVRHLPADDEPLFQKYPLHQAAMLGVERTWYVVEVTFKFLRKIIVGEQSIKQIGGAVSIGKGAGDAASGGFSNFMFFVAFLSISIGIVNLFPIPMLDGGHLVFYTLEALRGKPLGAVAQEWGYRIGFSCVVMLMILGLFNDAGRLANIFGLG
jgi:regulator of sigma E protease